MTRKTRLCELRNLLAWHVRYTENPAFYDAKKRRFRNIAPLGRNFPVSDAEVVSVGGPTFVSMHGSGAQGVKFDNSCHVRVPNWMAFQGLLFIAAEFHLPGATHDLPLLQVDMVANVSTIANLRVAKSSGVTRVTFNNATYASNDFGANTIAADTPFVALAGFDQEAGKSVRTLTGIAPYTEANPNNTSAVSGWPLSPSGDQDLYIGRLLNSAVDETPQAGYWIVHEMGGLIRTPRAAADQTTLQNVFASTKARLGI